MSAVTLQYSPTAVAPLPDAATVALDVTVAPVVGNPMVEAGIVSEPSCAQLMATGAEGVGGGPPSSLQAASRTATPTASEEVVNDGVVGRGRARRAWGCRVIGVSFVVVRSLSIAHTRQVNPTTPHPGEFARSEVARSHRCQRGGPCFG